MGWKKTPEISDQIDYCYLVDISGLQARKIKGGKREVLVLPERETASGGTIL